MARRRRLQAKNLIAVILTVMLLIGAVSVLLPLTDELDKMFSDSSSSSGTVNKPSGSNNSGNNSDSESSVENDNISENDDGPISIDDFVGDPEFFGDIIDSDIQIRDEDLIHLPIL